MSRCKFYMQHVKVAQLVKTVGCQHIFALLLAVEQYGPRDGEGRLPGEEPVTSSRQSWGPRERHRTEACLSKQF